jgi:hypothetical protein
LKLEPAFNEDNGIDNGGTTSERSCHLILSYLLSARVSKLGHPARGLVSWR